MTGSELAGHRLLEVLVAPCCGTALLARRGGLAPPLKRPPTARRCASPQHTFGTQPSAGRRPHRKEEQPVRLTPPGTHTITTNSLSYRSTTAAFAPSPAGRSRSQKNWVPPQDRGRVTPERKSCTDGKKWVQRDHGQGLSTIYYNHFRESPQDIDSPSPDCIFERIRLSSFLQSSSISSPITHHVTGRKNPRSSLRSPDSSYRPFLSHLLKQIPDKEVLLFVVQGFRDLVEQCRY